MSATPAPNGYSTAVIVAPNARGIAYISGRGARASTVAFLARFSPRSNRPGANLGAALEGIGASLDQVAKLTVYVVDHDMSKLGVLTQNVVEMFGANLPAQTSCLVPKLAIDPMLFEVEAVVVLD
ncbi:MAG: Rid family hydrolase [Terricaulis sp.]|nr:Rid family hydrolase [Terricaulis sp.]